MKRLRDLEDRISRATGLDPELDCAIHDALDPAAADGAVPPYTASVDACLLLIGKALPEWHWHVGHGPNGILPYALLTGDAPNPGSQVEVMASTVPLALLGALVKAVQLDRSATDKG